MLLQHRTRIVGLAFGFIGSWAALQEGVERYMIRRITHSIGPATWASVVLGLALSALAEVFADIGPIMLTVSLNMSFIVALFEQVVRINGERDRLMRFIGEIEAPYLSDLADLLLDATAEALHAMARPVRVFRSEAEFFDYACNTLSHLGAADSIIVACADSVSRWMNCPFLGRWLMNNASAVGRGVQFTRILLEVDPGLRSLAIEQARRGIHTIFLDEIRMNALPPKFRVPREMGFAVVNREKVYVHVGSGATFYGVFIENPMLATLVLSQLALLESHGEVMNAPETPKAA